MQQQKGQDLFPFCVDANGPVAWGSQEKIGKTLADYALKVCGVLVDDDTITKCAKVISDAAYTGNVYRGVIRVVRDKNGQIFADGPK